MQQDSKSTLGCNFKQWKTINTQTNTLHTGIVEISLVQYDELLSRQYCYRHQHHCPAYNVFYARTLGHQMIEIFYYTRNLQQNWYNYKNTATFLNLPFKYKNLKRNQVQDCDIIIINNIEDSSTLFVFYQDKCYKTCKIVFTIKKKKQIKNK